MRIDLYLAFVTTPIALVPRSEKLSHFRVGDLMASNYNPSAPPMPQQGGPPPGYPQVSQQQSQPYQASYVPNTGARPEEVCTSTGRMTSLVSQNSLNAHLEMVHFWVGHSLGARCLMIPILMGGMKHNSDVSASIMYRYSLKMREEQYRMYRCKSWS